jgi:hypothetical protein
VPSMAPAGGVYPAGGVPTGATTGGSYQTK